MRLFLTFRLAFFLLTATTLLPAVPPSHNWQEGLSQLHPGDHLRVSTNGSPIDGPFVSSTSQDITVGSTTTPKEAVLKIQRYRPAPGHPARRRAINAAIGATVGLAAGFAIGKVAGRCKNANEWFCGGDFSNDAGFAIGGAGFITGGIVGALLPQHHARETIYSFKR